MNMMEYRAIPFSPPDISDLEINEVIETLKSGWLTTGPKTKELEKRLAEFCHTSKVVCLNSATAAEELNFRICGIGEGDEVIAPAYTYTATASAAIHCGAKVIFIDSQPDSVEMDYAKVAEAITEKTKGYNFFRMSQSCKDPIQEWPNVFPSLSHRDVFVTVQNGVQRQQSRIFIPSSKIGESLPA